MTERRLGVIHQTNTRHTIQTGLKDLTDVQLVASTSLPIESIEGEMNSCTGRQLSVGWCHTRDSICTGKFLKACSYARGTVSLSQGYQGITPAIISSFNGLDALSRW
jgi:hypothetical protein